MGELFVRDCFPIYYDKIMASFTARNKRVSIVGSPGVGKSMFRRYVLSRLRTDWPTETFVVARFRRNFNLKQCLVYRPSVEEPEIVQSVPLGEEVVYLVDGAHWGSWPGRSVFFTRPRKLWFTIIENDWRHDSLFLPPWSLSEFLAVKTEVAEHEVRRRFALFGGAVDLCLTSDSGKVDRAKARLEKRLARISSPKDLLDLVDWVKCEPGDAQRISQRWPLNESDPAWEFTIDLASEFVRQEIQAQLGDLQLLQAYVGLAFPPSSYPGILSWMTGVFSSR